MARAWDMLHDPEIGGNMKADDLLKLALEAGFSAEEAQTIARNRAWGRMEREMEL